LYEKISKWLGVSEKNILLVPGSDGVIRQVFEAYIERGDTVIITSPTFAMYPVYCQMFGANMIEFNHQFSISSSTLDVGELIKLILKKSPKLVCLPNPDSPTGSILKFDDLSCILNACNRVGSIFLVDEAYHPFHSDSIIDLISNDSNLIVARTFSKAWGLAGLRVGYAASGNDKILYLNKMRPMYEIGAVSSEFISRVFDYIHIINLSVQRVLLTKANFEKSMRDFGYQVKETYGNFSQINFGNNSVEMHKILEKKFLFRKTFSHPSLYGYSRFSIGSDNEMLMLQMAIRGLNE
jgi:histidinol-phosphate aminotransferase